ncbi:hypothetical protein Hamer_G026562, partial [Homarus americanus]
VLPYTYTVLLHGTPAPYTFTAHLHGTPTRYTCTLYLHGTPSRYTCTLHLHGTPVRYTGTLRLHDTPTRYIYTLLLHGTLAPYTYTQHSYVTPALYTYALHLHFTPTRNIYTVHLQGTPTRYTCSLHLHDETQIRLAKIRNWMKDQATNTRDKPAQIFSHAVSQCHDDVRSLIPSADICKRTLRNQRPISPIPRLLKDLGELPTEFSQTVGPNPEEFLLYDNGPNANNRLLVFGTSDGLRLLACADTLYMDGNFAMAPNIFKHIYVIRVPFFDTAVTSVFALLPNKTRATYEELLQAIVDNGSFRPIQQPVAMSSDALMPLRMRHIPPMFAPHIWNVHDATMNNNARTNNICEGWNNKFFILVGHYHPSAWRVIEWFQREEATVSIIIQQDGVGNPPRRRVRRRYVQLQERIRNLQCSVRLWPRSNTSSVTTNIRMWLHDRVTHKVKQHGDLVRQHVLSYVMVVCTPEVFTGVHGAVHQPSTVQFFTLTDPRQVERHTSVPPPHSTTSLSGVQMVSVGPGSLLYRSVGRGTLGDGGVLL